MEIQAASAEAIVEPEYAVLYAQLVSMAHAHMNLSPAQESIYPECQLMLEGEQLVYYITSVHGYLGDGLSPFTIVVRERKLVAEKGLLDSLEKVRVFLENYNTGPLSALTVYEETRCLYLTQEINAWVKRGCPSIPGLCYHLYIANGVLCIDKLSTETLALHLTTGRLHLIDKATRDAWTFTDNTRYAIIDRHDASGGVSYISSYYERAAPYGHGFMTPELKKRAERLLEPLRLALLQ